MFTGVQNAAAGLDFWSLAPEGVTTSPVLRQLPWLPMRQRVEFKLAVLVYKALNNLAPPYLSDDCRLVANTRCRQIRSLDSRQSQVHYKAPFARCNLLSIRFDNRLKPVVSCKRDITFTSSRVGDRALLLPDLAFGTVFCRLDLSMDTFCHKLFEAPALSDCSF